jgi:hypothetical protein
MIITMNIIIYYDYDYGLLLLLFYYYFYYHHHC